MYFRYVFVIIYLIDMEEEKDYFTNEEQIFYLYSLYKMEKDVLQKQILLDMIRDLQGEKNA